MREIKFRGEKLSDNFWVEGHYYYSIIKAAHIIVESYDIPPSYSEPGGDIYSEHHEIDPQTLGQYTGLKDKDGKEIYEGDILYVDFNFSDSELDDREPSHRDGYSSSPAKAVIVWNQDMIRYQLKYIWVEYATFWGSDLQVFYKKQPFRSFPIDSYLKIIGNIYENPELS